jgi:hypothetical protein
MSLDANSDRNMIGAKFEEIAKELFNNYHIQKGDNEYYFMNLEFYFFNKGHQDIITYPRHLTEGKWFFHSSGVDLTLNSQLVSKNKKEIDANTDFFGGILIREIVRKNKSGELKKFIGPQVCEWELFDLFDALSPTACVPFVKRNKSLGEVKYSKCERHFTYNGDKIERKYNELIKIFNGINLKIKEFEDFLNAEYAYNVSYEDLRNRINNL